MRTSLKFLLGAGLASMSVAEQTLALPREVLITDDFGKAVISLSYSNVDCIGDPVSVTSYKSGHVLSGPSYSPTHDIEYSYYECREFGLYFSTCNSPLCDDKWDPTEPELYKKDLMSWDTDQMTSCNFGSRMACKYKFDKKKSFMGSSSYLNADCTKEDNLGMASYNNYEGCKVGDNYDFQQNFKFNCGGEPKEGETKIDEDAITCFKNDEHRPGLCLEDTEEDCKTEVYQYFEKILANTEAPYDKDTACVSDADDDEKYGCFNFLDRATCQAGGKSTFVGKCGAFVPGAPHINGAGVLAPLVVSAVLAPLLAFIL